MNFNYTIQGGRELILYLGKIQTGMRPQIITGLMEAADHLQEKVKGKFGQYQPSWPTLKRASVIAKYKRRNLMGASARGRNISFSVGPDDPLVLFGNLERSINKEVDESELEAIVYSDNEYSAVHEYGYAPKGIPARSYMRTTLDEESDEVTNIIANKIGRLI